MVQFQMNPAPSPAEHGEFARRCPVLFGPGKNASSHPATVILSLVVLTSSNLGLPVAMSRNRPGGPISTKCSYVLRGVTSRLKVILTVLKRNRYGVDSEAAKEDVGDHCYCIR